MQRVLYTDPYEELTRLSFGRVCAVNNATGIITVELRSAEGAVPAVLATCRLPENDKAPDVGARVEVLLQSGAEVPQPGSNRPGGALLGSIDRPLALEAFRRMSERETDTQEFKATLSRREGKGWLVSVDGFESYAVGDPPRSSAGKEPEPGDETRIQVQRLARDRGGFVVQFSSRLKQEIRNQAFVGLSVGDTVEGRVREIVAYGAFVEVETNHGAFVALLHNSEVSWAPNSKAEDFLQRDSQRQFQIIRIAEDDDGDQRVSLSLKALLPSPWDQYSDDLAEGDELLGVVSNVTDYGAFVEVLPGLDGLLHRSKLIPPSAAGEVADRFAQGDKVWCRVFKIERDKKRISLEQIPAPEFQSF